MTTKPTKRVRCAVYTRVSTEYGLDQEFNSLDAQHEAAEAYVRSQAHDGWTLIRTRYDDGGYSGGSTERPALQRLLGRGRALASMSVGMYFQKATGASLQFVPYRSGSTQFIITDLRAAAPTLGLQLVVVGRRGSERHQSRCVPAGKELNGMGRQLRTRARNSAGVHDFPKKFGEAREGKRLVPLHRPQRRTDQAAERAW
jgi:hypothetical protein